MESKEQVFKGLKKQTVSTLPLLKNNRKESFEYTLDVVQGNYGDSSFPRTTHLYKSDVNLLEDIEKNIKSGTNFSSSKIVHESSDLGLTHKIVAIHKSGPTLIFDGFYMRIVTELNAGYFSYDELLPLTGVPKMDYDIFSDFVNQCIKPTFPKESEYGHDTYVYYTIAETDWGKIGLIRKGDAQARLRLNDPNFITITAIIFSEIGKKFDVYIGDEDKINQMIAHDFFLMQEIETYSNIFSKKLECLINFQSEFKKCFEGAFLPIWKFNRKKEKWDHLKEMLISWYEIRELVEKGLNYTKIIQGIVDKKVAFFNGPRQIWVSGEEQDFEEKIQHSMTHFIELEIENNKLKANSEAIKPFYSKNILNLNNQLLDLIIVTDKVYQEEKDLLATYQTEFAFDAVKIATISIFLTLLTSIINIK